MPISHVNSNYPSLLHCFYSITSPCGTIPNMSYKNIPLGKPEQFNAVVEISKGGENKYEYDENLDSIKLDWVFSGGFHFPFDYCYIPQTRGGDGDHLDVFIIASHPLQIGTIVECRPVGMIELLDRGEEDNKILAVPVADLK